MHTPGPWTASTTPASTNGLLDKPWYSLYAPDDGMGTIVGHYKPAMFLTEAEAEANAKLMAQAPALLEALKTFVSHCDDARHKGPPNEALVQQARAAIEAAS